MLHKIAKMTRGNQREKDRERAANRKAAGPKEKMSQGDMIKKKMNDAEIMRQKQQKALEKKAQEEAEKKQASKK